VRHDVPPDLERIISRRLKKDVERRFQHMGDVRVALQELKEESQSGVKAAPKLHRRVRLSRRTAMVVAAVLMIVAVAGIWWWRVTPSRLPFRRVEMQALTTSGDVMEAAISPDGRYLARISARGDGQTVSLRHLRTGSEVHVLSVPRVAVGGLQFSRDGDYLYYTQEKEPSGAALYRVPSLGGSPEIVLDGVDRHVAVSPDGRRFAWSTGGTDKTSSVIVAGPNPGARETLVTWKEPDFFRLDLAWSPDAKLLAVPIGSVDDRYWQVERLLVLPLDRSSPKILWPGEVGCRRRGGLAAGREALLVNAALSGHPRVWVVPYPTGEPWETMNDLNDYWGVSVTSDSSAFVTVQQNERGEMWVTAPRVGAASQLTQTSSNGEDAAGIVWTQDGKLVYTQSGSGEPDLWISNADRTNPKRLTFGGVAILPEVTPDGRTIYFGGRARRNVPPLAHGHRWEQRISGYPRTRRANPRCISRWQVAGLRGFQLHGRVVYVEDCSALGNPREAGRSEIHGRALYISGWPMALAFVPR